MRLHRRIYESCRDALERRRLRAILKHKKLAEDTIPSKRTVRLLAGLLSDNERVGLNAASSLTDLSKRGFDITDALVLLIRAKWNRDNRRLRDNAEFALGEASRAGLLAKGD